MNINYTILLQNLTGSLITSTIYFAVLFVLYSVYVTYFGYRYAKYFYVVLAVAISMGTLLFLLGISNPYYTLALGKVATIVYINNNYLLVAIVGIYGIFSLRQMLTLLSTFSEANLFTPKKNKNALLSNVPLTEYVHTLCNYFNLATPLLYTTANMVVPYTTGLLKKIIVLPLSCITQLTEPELEAVLLHEIAHILRNDHVTNLLLILNKIVLGYNPFAAVLLQQCDLLREIACDDWVLQQQVKPTNYTSALYKIASANYYNKNYMHIGLGDAPHQLLLRIKYIHQLPTSSKLMLPYTKLILCTLLLLITIIKPQEITAINVNTTSVVHLTKALQQPTVNNKLAPQSVITVQPAKNGMQTKANTTTIGNTNKSSSKGVTALYISNAENNTPISCYVNHKLTTIQGITCTLHDSIVLYNPNIPATKIIESTNQVMFTAYNTLLTNTTNNDTAILTNIIPQAAILSNPNNMWYDKATTTYTALYNQTDNKYIITIRLSNSGTLVAIRYVVIQLPAVLNEISL